jgi:hypothetical protein
MHSLQLICSHLPAIANLMDAVQKIPVLLDLCNVTRISHAYALADINHCCVNILLMLTGLN